VNEELRSILLGTLGLSFAAGAAALLTVTRGRLAGSRPELRAAARAAVVATLLQSTHFAEELATGFRERFPELLGLTAWSPGFFVWFNLLWLAVWGISSWGLARGRRLALFPLWFLGIACLANGLAHPLLSARAGGYFPGLLTSPLVGIAGLLLLRHLLRVTGRAQLVAGSP
jgi:hypothetical protein